MELVLSEADKIHLTKKFAEFFKNSKNSEFIVFDLETNGLQGSEVLSISAQKCRLTRSKKIETLSYYERYYYPTKPYNWGAIKVNNLSELLRG